MNRLFGTISLILCAIAAMPAFAQQKDVLHDFAAKASSSKAVFEYKFSSGKSTVMEGSGKAAVQGNCFSLNGNGLEMTCDGRTLWTVDRSAEEVIVESVGSDDATGTAFNPALLISNLDKAFDVTSAKSATVAGKSAVTYVLAPKTDGTDLVSLTVSISADGASLLSAKSTMKDGTVTSFTIPSFKFVPKTDGAEFSVKESSFSKSYIITDLR